MFVRRTEKSLKRRTREDRSDRLGKDTRKVKHWFKGTGDVNSSDPLFYEFHVQFT